MAYLNRRLCAIVCVIALFLTLALPVCASEDATNPTQAETTAEVPETVVLDSEDPENFPAEATAPPETT